MARTIRTLDLVAGARIHLILPKRELFQRDTREPSASVILTMRGGRRLEANQVLAIQHLAAAAVPQLMPSRISIVDDQGALLARGVEEDIAGGGGVSRIDEFRIAFERRLKTNIETMLERSLGAGKVWAEVSVDLNYDQVTRNEEFFDPNGQVVRSTQTIEDANEARDARGAQPVTVAQNLPDAEGAGDVAGVNATNSLRTEETVNFEITRTMTETVTDAGALTRLSVAVMVDGTYIGIAPDDSYVARSEEELTQITDLVRSAVGFDADRGDQVSVINMKFARVETPEVVEVEPFLGLGRDEYFRVAELMIFAIIAMLVVLLVLRPLVSRALSIAQAQAQAAAAEQAAEAQLIAQQQVALAAPGMEGEPVSEVEQMIDMAQVEGRVRASSLKKVGELVDSHPEETLAIIRNWLYQG